MGHLRPKPLGSRLLCKHFVLRLRRRGKALRPSRQEGGNVMPHIALPDGASVHCVVDDFLWPWERSTPVVMMHGFARNAAFWARWVPAVAVSHRVYRPDLLGCGLSDQPPANY